MVAETPVKVGICAVVMRWCNAMASCAAVAPGVIIVALSGAAMAAVMV